MSTVKVKNGDIWEAVSAIAGPQGPQGPQGDAGATGNGIASITKTGTSGLVDTYTVTYTDGTTTTFTVTNGQDGQDGADGLGVTDVVASEYDPTSTYAVDDYVLYNNHLYRCTTAITTAETWTAAHWTEIVLCDEFTDLKDDLSGLVGALATEETQQTIEGETDSIVGLLQQIVEQGHSSGDLNGYSLNPGAGDELLITYKNPEDETDTVTIVAPTNTTMTAIASALADLANTWKGAIITNG